MCNILVFFCLYLSLALLFFFKFRLLHLVLGLHESGNPNVNATPQLYSLLCIGNLVCTSHFKVVMASTR